MSASCTRKTATVSSRKPAKAVKKPKGKPVKTNPDKSGTAFRPTFRPTGEQRATVEQMATYGIPADEIAVVVAGGIDEETLRSHFRRELESGTVKSNTLVAEALFKLATEGNATAAIFWAKTRMGWKDASAADLEGSVAVRTMTDEQIDNRLAQLLRKAGIGDAAGGGRETH